MKDDYHFMKLALKEADRAFMDDEVPVGVVLVDNFGKIAFKGHNIKEANKDIWGHAEIIALKTISSEIGDWRLNDYTMYVTLEPCIMCMASLVHARIKRLVFGAYDPKGGAVSLNYPLYKDQRLNHNFPVMGGLLQEESAELLKRFFKDKRKSG